MVSFVEDEFHFARQSSVFFVILQDNVLEVHFHRYGLPGPMPCTGLHSKLQPRNSTCVSSRSFALEGVAGAFLLHHVDVEGFHQQADFASCLEGMVVLHHQLVALRASAPAFRSVRL